jgi:glutamate dehydrogenase/leucine dehydrogenase
VGEEELGRRRRRTVTRVAINGFGRIGRLFLRAAIERGARSMSSWSTM